MSMTPSSTDHRPMLLSRIMAKLWQLAISPVTFVVVSLLWCLDLGAGSLLAYWRPDLFGSLDSYPFTLWLRQEGPRAWPYAIWVYLLMVFSWLMVASLFLCTVHWLFFRRKRLKGLGELLVHLGFLLVFAGYVIGAAFGARTLGVRLPLGGGSVGVAGMDVGLTLRGISPLLSRTGQVQGAVSDLVLTRGGVVLASGKVWINHPMIAGATVVYPRGVQQQVEGVRLLLNGTTFDLVAGRPYLLPGGQRLKVAQLVQADEASGTAQGPGVVVAVREPGVQVSGAIYLTPREGEENGAMVAGQRLTLVELLGPQYAVFDLHRDPGCRAVLLGALLITLGSIWALAGFLREGPVQSGGRQ